MPQNCMPKIGRCSYEWSRFHMPQSSKIHTNVFCMHQPKFWAMKPRPKMYRDGGGEVTDPLSDPNEESPMKYPSFLARKEHISRSVLLRFLSCIGMDNSYQHNWAERGIICQIIKMLRLEVYWKIGDAELVDHRPQIPKAPPQIRSWQSTQFTKLREVKPFDVIWEFDPVSGLSLGTEMVCEDGGGRDGRGEFHETRIQLFL